MDQSNIVDTPMYYNDEGCEKGYTTPNQGPTLRYFKTPADFCEIALKEALALFSLGDTAIYQLRLLLSDFYTHNPKVAEILINSRIPYEYTPMLPPDAWMLIRDCDKGDIFYCPGA